MPASLNSTKHVWFAVDSSILGHSHIAHQSHKIQFLLSGVLHGKTVLVFFHILLQFGNSFPFRKWTFHAVKILPTLHCPFQLLHLRLLPVDEFLLWTVLMLHNVADELVSFYAQDCRGVSTV